jgi:hypothetical protein
VRLLTASFLKRLRKRPLFLGFLFAFVGFATNSMIATEGGHDVVGYVSSN